ncbi:MAG: cobalamin biosynthesis protein CbiA [Desulfobacteraceae bacterium 4572_130]|nr:MAG: cobalamin biosynthesis protein CbiA [Desulfobacteraceae bacterium 4572_130]
MLDIKLNGIVIITGNYGSGKTETGVNLAFYSKKKGLNVSIADLDLVNPYFRTRQALEILTKANINVILPDKQYMHADLPILTPKVAAIIKKSNYNDKSLTILDAGGDDAGVNVIAALNDFLSKKKVNMLQIVNPFRPFTENIKGCIKIKQEIEASSKLKITGLVSNANLIDDTTIDNIYKGYELIEKLSEKTGIKVEFITADVKILSILNLKNFDCPVLPITRKLVPPWKRS